MKTLLRQTRDNFIDNAGITLFEKCMTGLEIFSNGFLKDHILRSDAILFSTVLKAEAIKQGLALTNYEDIRSLNFNSLFIDLLGTTISPETLRQKLNYIAKQEGVFDAIDRSTVEVLKKANIKKEIYGNKEYYVLDIDVSPFCNPKVKKEGVSWTYKGFEGYAPIFGYIGHYGVAFDLRPGSQHSENGAIEFLDRCFNIVEKALIPLVEVLVRVDSGHDDSKFIKLCENRGVKYIIARNRRQEKDFEYVRYVKQIAEPVIYKEEPNERHYRCVIDEKKPSNYQNAVAQCIYDISEKILDKDGKMIDYITDPNDPNFGREKNIEYKIASYWTNIQVLDQSGKLCNDKTRYVNECIDAYRQHATSEQYHSEIKTDMKMELLPSKYFKTNRLLLALSVISYNILRLISDVSLSVEKKFQHKKNETTERIRISTILKKLINIPCKLIKHARNQTIIFSKNFQYFSVFKKLFCMI